MSIDELAQFAASNSRSPAARKGSTRATWVRPTMYDFAQGNVIAIDQTVTHTGLCVLACGGPGLLHVDHAESYRIESENGAQGHEDTLQRSVVLFERLRDTLQTYRDPSWVLVHELPLPIRPNPKIKRPESSLVAATAVRIVAHTLRLPVVEMVGAQTHKRIICGIPNADKIKYHAALNELAFDLRISGLDKITNEGQRDALGIALAHLHRERENGL